MDISLLLGLAAQYPKVMLLLQFLGILVVVGQVVVVLTPSKKDDEAWDALKAKPVIGSLLSAIASFAPIQKK